MSACLGWPGPCPVNGQFHGCTRPNGHRSRRTVHECVCGEKLGDNPRDIKNPYQETAPRQDRGAA